ncbi:hypothetical protein D3C72_2539250 [compost metagenome]
MFLGEIIGRAEAMAAAADDDDVIRLTRLGRDPLGFPALVGSERLAGHGKNRIFAHSPLTPVVKAIG